MIFNWNVTIQTGAQSFETINVKGINIQDAWTNAMKDRKDGMVTAIALDNAPTSAIESTKFGTYVIRKPNGSLATHYGGTVAEFKTRAEAESCVGLLVN
jgi:hypothetical protein